MIADPVAALACCHCAGALESTSAALRCRDCARAYPILGGVPCLMPDPALFRVGWHGRLVEHRSMIDSALQGLAAERDRDNLPARTRERLLRLVGGMQTMGLGIETLMAPLVGAEEPVPLPIVSARTSSGPLPRVALSVLHHYEYIFRDWAWGAGEIERQRLLLTGLFPATTVERVAVYGSGAGRLAAELHAHLAAEHTVQTFALDINPLPLLAAHELTRGNTLHLVELPVAPRSEEQVAVQHRLSAPSGLCAPHARAGLAFLLADASTPPFAPGSLDVVVTPWFIDVVGVDLAVTASAINRVLRRGGLWLNLGPLLFKGEISGQHAIGETLDVVRDGGFEVLADGSDEAPYFRSPHSASWRVETQYWFSARKTTDHTLARQRTATLPAWLQDSSLPVPPLPELAQLHRSSIFTIGVLSMVDGTRSVADMAAVLAQSWNAEPAVVENQLRAFFDALLSQA